MRKYKVFNLVMAMAILNLFSLNQLFGQAKDYGDAPGSLACVDDEFHQLYQIKNPAFHFVQAGNCLGATVSSENATHQLAWCTNISSPGFLQDADGDDGDDGVQFISIGGKAQYLYSGRANTINVIGGAAVTSGYISIWVDLNQDGDWEDPNEKMISGLQIHAGNNAVTLPMYPPSMPTGQTYFRIRFGNSINDVANNFGGGNVGEVEDYRVHIVRKNNPCGSQVENGSFEFPINANAFLLESEVPGWATYPHFPAGASNWASRNSIEFWKSGANIDNVTGVEGNQFIELNAYTYGTIYQDIQTEPGQTLVWRFSHKGRTVTDVVKVVATNMSTNTPTEIILKQASDAAYAWRNHTGTFTVPAGQYVTRIAFTSIIPPYFGSPSTGNLLDDIYFESICDFGDAPNQYQTLSASQGAAHAAFSNLYLGQTVNAELDGKPGIDANLDTDDGVAQWPDIKISSGGHPYQISVTTKNTTGAPANLSAWIDFNRDGIFQATELASATIANGQALATLTWNVPFTIQMGKTYARIRIVNSANDIMDDPNTPIDERSFGAVMTGEVEDYPLTINSGIPGGVNAALSLWLDATHGTQSSGGLLSNWTDRSGHNQFTKNGPIQYSAGNLNFNASVQFVNNTSNGANMVPPTQYLQGDNAITVADAFAVFKLGNTSKFVLLGSASAPVFDFGETFFGSFGSDRMSAANGSMNKTAYFPFSERKGFHLFNLDVSSNTSPFASGKLDGVQQTMGTDGLDVIPTHFVPMIGGSLSNHVLNPYPFLGDLAEIIVFESSLSATNKIKVESYLAIKYGIRKSGNYLRSNDQIIWDSAANQGFNNHIFGIARDDNASLHQKIAIAERNIQTATTGLIIANGDLTPATFPANNQQYTNLISSDLSSLLVGDNGKPAVFSLPINQVPNRLMSRVWKMQKTGSGISRISILMPDSVLQKNKTIGLLFSADGINWVPNDDKIMQYDSVRAMYAISVDLASIASTPYFTFADFSFTVEFATAGSTNVNYRAPQQLILGSLESNLNPRLIHVKYWGIVSDPAGVSFSTSLDKTVRLNAAVMGTDFQMPNQGTQTITIPKGKYFQADSVEINYSIIDNRLSGDNLSILLQLNTPNSIQVKQLTNDPASQPVPFDQLKYFIYNNDRAFEYIISVKPGERPNFYKENNDSINGLKIPLIIRRFNIDPIYTKDDTVYWKLVPSGLHPASPQDFLGQPFDNHMVIFKKGTSQAVLNFYYLKGDRLLEFDETYQIQLTSPNDENVDTSGKSNVIYDKTIIDDDRVNHANYALSIHPVNHGIEGSAQAKFTVRLPNGVLAPEDLSIHLSYGGTAVNGLDYTIPSTPVIIKAGENSTTVTLPILDDQMIELIDTVTISLNAAKTSFDQQVFYNDSLNSQVHLTITDNDDMASNKLVTATVLQEGTEGGANALVRFSLPAGITCVDPITIYFLNFKNGNAIKNLDFTFNSFTIPAGSNYVDGTFQIIDDKIIEGKEWIALDLLATSPNFSGFNPHANSAPKVAINDNDASQAILQVVRNADAKEGGAPGVFKVSLPNNLMASSPIQVLYSIAGTAQAGVQYTALTGTATIPAGDNFTSIQVNPINDNIIFNSKTVVLQLQPSTDANGNTYSILPSQQSASLMIIDNDGLSSDLELRMAPYGYQIAENKPINIFGYVPILLFNKINNQPVIASEDINIPVQMDPASTATNGIDYQLTVEFKAGKDAGRIIITPIDDHIIEGNEILHFTISNASSANFNYGVSPTQNTASFTLIDDDTAASDLKIGVTVKDNIAEPNKDGSIIFSLPAGKVAASDIAINYQLSGTAKEGLDYQSLGQITIPAGSNSIVLPIYVLDDKLIEGDESIILKVLGGASQVGSILYTAAVNHTATLQISDDENTASNKIISVSKGLNAAEGATGAEFIISLVPGVLASSPITINYTLAGTATEGLDFVQLTKTALIPAGANSVTIPISIVDDKIIEPTESIEISLNTNNNDLLGNVFTVGKSGTASMMIADNDHTSNNLVITASNITDGKENGNSGSFLLSLPSGITSTADIHVDFVKSGTATDSIDCQLPLHFIIPAGQNAISIQVPILTDNIIEGTENMILQLVSAGNNTDTYSFAPGSETVTISILDANAQDAKFAVHKEQDAIEGGSTGAFKFSLPANLVAANDVVIQYQLSGTAIAGVHMLTPFASVTIPAGASDILLPIVPINDVVIRPTTDVKLTISSVTDGKNVWVIQPAEATVNIFDNDATQSTLQLSVRKDADASEPSKAGNFTITIPYISSEDIAIAYTLKGTAIAGTDYEPIANTIILPANSDRVSIPIIVKDDQIIEGNENIIFTLLGGCSTSFKYNVSQATASLQITDDDTSLSNRTLGIKNITHAAEPNKEGSFQIGLPNGFIASEPIQITYAIQGTATSGLDFHTLSGLATIDAGFNATTIQVPIINDQIIEGDEFVSIQLKSIVTKTLSYQMDTTKSQLMIADDDLNSNNLQLLIASSTDLEEPGTNGSFTIALPNGITSAQDIAISYGLTGTALEGKDYEKIGSIILPANLNSINIPLLVKDDKIIEGTEKIMLQLIDGKSKDGSLLYASNIKNQAVIEIKDDDNLSNLLKLTVKSMGNAAEPNVDGVFQFKLPNGYTASTDIGILYALSGDAIPNLDYHEPNQLLLLKAGDSIANLSIQVLDDKIIEQDETISLFLLGGIGADGKLFYPLIDTASLKIMDNDLTAANKLISISKISDAIEAGPDGQIQLALPAGITNQLPINIQISKSGSAIAGTDYKDPGVIILPANTNSILIPITAIDDAIIKTTSTAIFSIVNATDGKNSFSPVVQASSASVNIYDNDGIPANEIISIVKIQDGKEHLNNGLFRISIPKQVTEDLKIAYQLGGTAVVNKDYLPIGEIVIPKGKLFVDVSLNILDDNEIESNETFVCRILSGRTNAFKYQVDIVDSMLLTITDDDALVLGNKQIGVHRINDGKEGSLNGLVQFHLPAGITSNQPILINYTISGNAKEGEDYAPIGSHIYLPAGVNFINLPIRVLQDLVVEPTENITVDLVSAVASDGTNYTIDTSAAKATILIADDDHILENFTINLTTLDHAAEPSKNGLVSFYLPTGISFSEDITVNLLVTGSAVENKDYSKLPAITIPAGKNSIQVPVAILDDQMIEGDEQIILTILNGKSSSYVLQPGTHPQSSLTIQDNEDINSNRVVGIRKIQDASEPSSNGLFEIYLPNGITIQEALKVNFVIDNISSASNGLDYTLPTEFMIPAGMNKITVPLTVLDDHLIEGNEMLRLSILGASLNGRSYSTALNNASIDMNIGDDDQTNAISIAIKKQSDASEAGRNGSFSLYLPKGYTYSKDISISYLVSGTASALDYLPFGTAGKIVFPANTNELILPIIPVDDAIAENTESLQLVLSTANGIPGTIALDASPAILHILDNDGLVPSTDQLSVTTLNDAAEPNTHGLFRISLPNPASNDVFVSFDLLGSTASKGNDFSIQNIATIAAGTSFVDVPVLVVDDNIPEQSEFVQMNIISGNSISNSYPVNASKASSKITIVDNDHLPVNFVLQLKKISDAAEPSTNGAFEISLPVGAVAASDINVNISYAGTAIPNRDYRIKNATLTAGNNKLVVPVEVINNTMIDSTRTVELTLKSGYDQNGNLYTIANGSSQASIHILDDDTLLSNKTIAISTIANAKEPSSTGYIKFSLPANVSYHKNITIGYLVSGTATASNDYIALSGTAQITAGNNYVLVPVTPKDDQLIEGVETVIITGSTVDYGFVFANLSTTMNLGDNDDVFSNTGVSNTVLSLKKIADAAEPATNGMFRISLPAGYLLQENLVIDLMSSGTAISNKDYAGMPKQIILPAGANFIDIPVAVIDDKIVEGTKDLNLQVVGAKTSNLSFLQGTLAAKALINDDEMTASSLQLTVSKVKDAEEFNSVNGLFRISLPTGVVVNQNVLVNYFITGTALPVVDYVNILQSITIPAGANSVDVSVPVLNDTIQEPVETVIMNLTGGISAAGILFTSNSSATVNIINRGGDLSITKEILKPSNAKTVLGGTVEYQIKVSFTGTINYHQIILTDSLPGGLSDPLDIQVGTGLVSYNKNTRKITWVIDSMKSGEVFPMLLTVKVAEGGNILNKAVVLANESELNYQNNSASVSMVAEGVDIFIPNTITPNGDGKNDKWIIPALSRYTGADMTIYNRWGTQVFHSVNYNNDWDAAGLGGGTYYYVLKLSAAQSNKIYKGYIEVLK